MKLKSAICTLLLCYVITKIEAQNLDEVLSQGNTSSSPIYINEVLINKKNKSYIVLGHNNNIEVGMNTYILGFKNTVNTSNATIAGYENIISSGQSGSIFGKYNNVAGHAPMVFGYRNFLEGESNKSIAIGRDNINYGYITTSMGNRNYVNGAYTFAVGNWNESFGNYTIAIGHRNKVDGTRTTALGYSNTILGSSHTGSIAVGYGNTTNSSYAVAIGLGINNALSNSLMIGVNDNSKMTFLSNGNVLIAKTTQANNTYKLDVNGNIRANKVVVNTSGADFVFDSTYKLLPLQEVEAFILQNKHLPDIPSAIEMQNNGLDMGDQQTKLLQKVEELTLYLIEQSKKIEQLQSEINSFKKKKKNR